MSGEARKALLVGASRGLGLGLAGELLGRGWNVTATTRQPSAELDRLAGDRLRVETVDIDRDEQVAALRRTLDGTRFDLLFVVAGISNGATTPAFQVERPLASQVFQTNAVSPIRFVEAFHDLIAPDGTLALMSSVLGSISSNTAGGWEIYRASKAALNTLARSFAVRHQDAPWGVVLMHPGWVRTDMGGPNATLDVATSVRGMADALEQRRGQRDCAYLDYRGETVPW